MSQQFGAGSHPDLPPFLVHFTGRPRGTFPNRGDVPPEPRDRLGSILSCGYIQAFGTFGTCGPVVCVSEVSVLAMQALFSTGVTSRGPYPPWAVVLHRDAAIAQEFRPVWYMSEEEQIATRELPMLMRDRRVSYTPGRVDWLAEREWRRCWGDSPIDPGFVPAIGLNGLIMAVVVGQQGWEPPRGVHPERNLTVTGLLWNGVSLVQDGILTW